MSDLLILAGTATTAILGLVGSFVVAKSASRPAAMSAKADWQQALNEGFSNLAEQHAADRKADRNRIDQLTGAIRDLAQHIASLERILRDHNIPVPLRPAITLPEFPGPDENNVIRFNQTGPL